MTVRKLGESAIGEKAVFDKTGKSWKEWFEILDNWGAARKSHREIARYLFETWEVSPWCSQTLTVRYEQERGLRSPGQRSDRHFTLSIRRTIRSSVVSAFLALVTPGDLSHWLSGLVLIDARSGGRSFDLLSIMEKLSDIHEPMRLRYDWNHIELAPGSKVEITIEPKGENKILLTLEHSKIINQTDYYELRAQWGKTMDALKSSLEKE